MVVKIASGDLFFNILANTTIRFVILVTRFLSTVRISTKSTQKRMELTTLLEGPLLSRVPVTSGASFCSTKFQNFAKINIHFIEIFFLGTEAFCFAVFFASGNNVYFTEKILFIKVQFLWKTKRTKINQQGISKRCIVKTLPSFCRYSFFIALTIRTSALKTKNRG